MAQSLEEREVDVVRQVPFQVTKEKKQDSLFVADSGYELAAYCVLKGEHIAALLSCGRRRRMQSTQSYRVLSEMSNSTDYDILTLANFLSGRLTPNTKTILVREPNAQRHP